jgi:hypothetical protein
MVEFGQTGGLVGRTVVSGRRFKTSSFQNKILSAIDRFNPALFEDGKGVHVHYNGGTIELQPWYIENGCVRYESVIEVDKTDMRFRDKSDIRYGVIKDCLNIQ